MTDVNDTSDEWFRILSIHFLFSTAIAAEIQHQYSQHAQQYQTRQPIVCNRQPNGETGPDLSDTNGEFECHGHNNKYTRQS